MSTFRRPSLIQCAAALIAVLVFCPALAHANAVSFSITIDTTSLSADSGFLDFQFQPGGTSQLASATVFNFAPAANLTPGSATLSGDVTGTLPPGITISNDLAFNDYFVPITFANSLSFLVTLAGPAVDTPNPGSFPDGSAFGFGMFAGDGFTPLLTPDPNGFAVTIDLNPNGSTTVNTFSPQASVIAATPEPASIGFMLSGLAGILFAARKLRNATSHWPTH